MTGKVISVNKQENTVRVEIVDDIAYCIPMIQEGDCVSIERDADTDELRAYDVVPCVEYDTEAELRKQLSSADHKIEELEAKLNSVQWQLAEALRHVDSLKIDSLTECDGD